MDPFHKCPPPHDHSTSPLPSTCPGPPSTFSVSPPRCAAFSQLSDSCPITNRPIHSRNGRPMIRRHMSKHVILPASKVPPGTAYNPINPVHVHSPPRQPLGYHLHFEAFDLGFPGLGSNRLIWRYDKPTTSVFCSSIPSFPLSLLSVPTYNVPYTIHPTVDFSVHHQRTPTTVSKPLHAT